MSADNADPAAEVRQPCDDWLELVTAADCAGRWAARQLACCCSPGQLARGGSVSVSVEPADSPVVAWLHHHGYGIDTSTGVLLPVAVTAEALRPAAWATRKSQSLLVRHAYAAAFCTVLAEEAGVVAEIRLTVDRRPCRTSHPHPAQLFAFSSGTEPTAGEESERVLI